MNMNIRTRIASITAASAVFLASCGGGGGTTIEVKALEAWRVAENTVIKAYSNTDTPEVMDLREAFDEVVAGSQLHDYWHLLEKSSTSLEVQLWEPKPDDVIESDTAGASEHRLVQSEDTTTSVPTESKEQTTATDKDSDTTTTEPAVDAETETETTDAPDSSNKDKSATTEPSSESGTTQPEDSKTESTKVLLYACIEHNGEEWESSNGACEESGKDGSHQQSEGTSHDWSYEGTSGPAKWGSMNDAWLVCEEGTSQSPIEIGKAEGTDMPNPVFSYKKGTATVEDNGHTVVFTPETANTVKIDDNTWTLKQMHYHAPGEHSLDGEKSPVEVHLVHQDAGDHYMVIGLMLKGGGQKDAWGFAGQTENTEIDWAGLLPSSMTTVRYKGSLTTPPCSEGVNWVLMTEPVEVSDKTIDAFASKHSGNNRPVQEIGDRVVERDITSGK